MERAIRSGIAMFNSGAFHEAHDAWEPHWLALETGTPDERFLHGLIQYTAAVHHATTDNPVGARGLASSSLEYLASLGPTYRQVALSPVRQMLLAISADPSVVTRIPIPPLLQEGHAWKLEELSWRSLSDVAITFAETTPGIDAAGIEHIVEQIDSEGPDPYSELIRSFVIDSGRREIIGRRLLEHWDREETRTADVAGLFESRSESDADETQSS